MLQGRLLEACEPVAMSAQLEIDVPELRRLKAENGRLRGEVAELRKDLAAARAEIRSLKGEVVVEEEEVKDEVDAGVHDARGADERLQTAPNAVVGDVCAFCGAHHGTPVSTDEGTLEGDLLYPPFNAKGKAVWVHERCAMYSAEVHSVGDVQAVLHFANAHDIAVGRSIDAG